MIIITLNMVTMMIAIIIIMTNIMMMARVQQYNHRYGWLRCCWS